MEIKTLFLISYFNLSRKTKWHFRYTDCYVLEICAGNVLAFKENHTKIKKQGVFICFLEKSLKFLIAN